MEQQVASDDRERTSLVREGAVECEVPRGLFVNEFHATDRSLTICAIEAFVGNSITAQQRGQGGTLQPRRIEVCELFAASGIRALRFAKEIRCPRSDPELQSSTVQAKAVSASSDAVQIRVHANDRCSSAVKWIRSNARRNKVKSFPNERPLAEEEKAVVTTTCHDAVDLLSRAAKLLTAKRNGQAREAGNEHAARAAPALFPPGFSGWDVLDLDPFGSCQPFVLPALRAAAASAAWPARRQSGCLVGFTFFDTHDLCGGGGSGRGGSGGGNGVGGGVRSCLRKFGSLPPLKRWLCREEVGLRIAARSVLQAAQEAGISAHLVLATSFGLCLRLFVRVTPGNSAAGEGEARAKAEEGARELPVALARGCGACGRLQVMTGLQVAHGKEAKWSNKLDEKLPCYCVVRRKGTGRSTGDGHWAGEETEGGGEAEGGDEGGAAVCSRFSVAGPMYAGSLQDPAFVAAVQERAAVRGHGWASTINPISPHASSYSYPQSQSLSLEAAHPYGSAARYEQVVALCGRLMAEIQPFTPRLHPTCRPQLQPQLPLPPLLFYDLSKCWKQATTQDFISTTSSKSSNSSSFNSSSSSPSSTPSPRSSSASYASVHSRLRRFLARHLGHAGASSGVHEAIDGGLEGNGGNGNSIGDAGEIKCGVSHLEPFKSIKTRAPYESVMRLVTQFHHQNTESARRHKTGQQGRQASSVPRAAAEGAEEQREGQRPGGQLGRIVCPCPLSLLSPEAVQRNFFTNFLSGKILSGSKPVSLTPLPPLTPHSRLPPPLSPQLLQPSALPSLRMLHSQPTSAVLLRIISLDSRREVSVAVFPSAEAALLACHKIPPPLSPPSSSTSFPASPPSPSSPSSSAATKIALSPSREQKHAVLSAVFIGQAGRHKLSALALRAATASRTLPLTESPSSEWDSQRLGKEDRIVNANAEQVEEEDLVIVSLSPSEVHALADRCCRSLHADNLKWLTDKAEDVVACSAADTTLAERVLKRTSGEEAKLVRSAWAVVELEEGCMVGCSDEHATLQAVGTGQAGGVGSGGGWRRGKKRRKRKRKRTQEGRPGQAVCLAVEEGVGQKGEAACVIAAGSFY